jgi:hypothetical protein
MLAAALSLILLAQPQGSNAPAQPFISNEVGGIKGEIHDRKGDPVPRVRINLKRRDGQNWISFTDEQGRFKAGSLPPGEYQLELSKEKYQTVIYTKVLIKANAWLLGVSHGPHVQKPKGSSELTLIGSPNYEYPATFISPPTRPKIEKIPMH